MSDIFISYERSNRNAAEQLAAALADRGWTVWWDREIPAGQSFDEVIEREIDAAKCIVVLWSRSSVASRWVRLEASEGANRGILVPALIDDDVRIPLEFRKLQAICLTGWQGEAGHPDFAALMSAVDGLLGASASTVRRPAKAASRARGGQARPRKPAAVPEGIYLDRKAGLMWTVRDNGADINWEQATDYAKRLRLGGFSDWRLPTLVELEGLYEPNNGNPNDIREPLRLSSWIVWSSTMGKKEAGIDGHISDAAWFFVFKGDEDVEGGYSGLSALYYPYGEYSRALCVRTVR